MKGPGTFLGSPGGSPARLGGRPAGALEVVLASTSPRRLAVLRMLGIEPRVIEPRGAERSYRPPARPAAYAVGQALAKLRATGRLGERAVGLAADTIVVVEGRVLGKPASPVQARKMLAALSGKSHEVITGVALSYAGREVSGSECTKVTFRELDGREIARYVEGGEPLDKAAAYGIQGPGAVLVRRVEGCFYNVVGLPVARVVALLSDLGLRYDPGSGAVGEWGDDRRS